MADWWNSIQKGAQEAAETTKFVSMRTKLQAEVMYVENQIKTCLQKFGVEVFPHMENNNSAQVQQHFTDTKREVENYREQIAAKNVEIAELNKQIENIGKAAGQKRDGVTAPTLARANAFDASGTATRAFYPSIALLMKVRRGDDCYLLRGGDTKLQNAHSNPPPDVELLLHRAPA